MSQKRNIKLKYARRIRTPKTAQRFILASTLETKLDLVSELGIGWAIVFFDRGLNGYSTLKQLIKELPCGKQLDTFDEVAQHKVYVLTDRAVAHSMALSADSMQGRNYSRSLMLAKAGYNPMKWEKEINEKYLEESLEASESVRYFANTVLNTIINLELSKDLTGLSENQFKVLCYLFINHFRYVHYDEILERFIGVCNKTKITTSLRVLEDKGMLRSSLGREREFQISPIGIKTMGTFWKQILKANEIG